MLIEYNFYPTYGRILFGEACARKKSELLLEVNVNYSKKTYLYLHVVFFPWDAWNTVSFCNIDFSTGTLCITVYYLKNNVFEFIDISIRHSIFLAQKISRS